MVTAPTSQGACSVAGSLRGAAGWALPTLFSLLAWPAIALSAPSDGSVGAIGPVEKFDRICLETQAEINRAATAAASVGFDKLEEPDLLGTFAREMAQKVIGMSRIDHVEFRKFSERAPDTWDSGAVFLLGGWRDDQFLNFSFCMVTQNHDENQTTVAQITEATAEALARRIEAKVSVSNNLSPDHGDVSWEWGPATGSSEEGFISLDYRIIDGRIVSFLSVGIVKEAQ